MAENCYRNTVSPMNEQSTRSNVFYSQALRGRGGRSETLLKGLFRLKAKWYSFIIKLFSKESKNVLVIVYESVLVVGIFSS